ncbi:MAG: hypothetical protein ACPGUD_14440 [Parashewanella sp.]
MAVAGKIELGTKEIQMQSVWDTETLRLQLDDNDARSKFDRDVESIMVNLNGQRYKCVHLKVQTTSHEAQLWLTDAALNEERDELKLKVTNVISSKFLGKNIADLKLAINSELEQALLNFYGSSMECVSQSRPSIKQLQNKVLQVKQKEPRPLTGDLNQVMDELSGIHLLSRVAGEQSESSKGARELRFEKLARKKDASFWKFWKHW